MQVNIALLTVTDTRTIENDKSGAILVKKIKENNHNLIDRKIVKDEKDQIKKILLEWIKKDNLDVIITTGGTGLTGRDITPEAIREITDKEIILMRPMMLIQMSKGIGLGPFMFSAPQHQEYRFNKASVVSYTKTEVHMAKKYAEGSTGLKLT